MKKITRLCCSSFKQKLILIMMAISSSTLIIMALFIITNYTLQSQHITRLQLITLADILGANSNGALSFNDYKAGHEVLNTLKLKHAIVYAYILDNQNKIFVHYGKESITPLWLNHTESYHSNWLLLWHNLYSNRMWIERNIYLDNEKIGVIGIVSNLNQLRNDIMEYIIIVIILSALCLLLSYLFCNRLQKYISTPILNLKDRMDQVSLHNDYSIRIQNNENNELGDVINGFNQMLAQIQSRDNRLAAYRKSLEQQISKRNNQLSTSQNKRILWLETSVHDKKYNRLILN